MSTETDKIESQKLEEALETLKEHFDIVTIFASKRDSDNSPSDHCVRHGNLFGCYGQVKLWVTNEEHYFVNRPPIEE